MIKISKLIKNKKKILKFSFFLGVLLFLLSFSYLFDFSLLINEILNLNLDKSSVINFGIFGEVDILSVSLFFLSMIIGLVDGFNPCALWILIYMISILTQIDDKKKMLAIGSIFLISSGALYFLILLLWLFGWNIINLFPYSDIFVKIVALIAVGSGIYFIYDYIKSRGKVECKVGDFKKRRKLMNRIKDVISRKLTFVTFFLIVFLAITINSIEFFCSAGLPALFTEVLVLSKLSFLEEIFYMLNYVLFFMLDDILIFFFAYFAIKSDVLEKYAGISHLVGGIVMMIVGFLLFFY